jgi:hypothetical protein
VVEIARGGGRSHWLPTEVAVTLGAVCVVALLAATGVGSALVYVAVFAAIALAISAIPQRYRSGALVAAAMIAAVDGLPGPDLTKHIVINGLYEQDFAIFLLMGLLISEIYTYRLWRFFSSGLGKALLMFALLNVAWWFFTLYRTSWVFGIHINHAANFGRPFLYIAILTPLFAGAMQRRETRAAMFVVAGAWSLVISGASIVGAAHASSFTQALLHVTTIRQSGSLTRLYVHAEDLLAVTLMFSIAFLFGSANRGQRRFAGLVAAFAAVAIGLLQTRAYYVGCIGGALVASLVYMSSGDSRAPLKRLLLVLVTLGLVIGGIFLVAPGSGTTQAINQVTFRAASGIGAASSQNQATSTVAVREAELQLLEQRLGNHWGLGLGFIDPRDQWDLNLPFGSIQNTDVGLFNVVITMGVVGAVLYYLAIVVVAVMLVVKSRALRGERRLYAQGALGACVLTMITSLTLMSFFGPTGIATVAAAIGVGAAVVQGADAADEKVPQLRSKRDPAGAELGVIV